MPQQEYLHMFQDAVVWPLLSYDSYGQPTHSAPIELLHSEGNGVRWNDYLAERKDAQGNSIQIVGDVTACQAIANGSLMWQGTLEDWYGTGSSGTDTNLCQVIKQDPTPDVKGRAYNNVHTLMRWKGKVGG